MQPTAQIWILATNRSEAACEAADAVEWILAECGSEAAGRRPMRRSSMLADIFAEAAECRVSSDG
jgi:hypothetical protein